MHHGGVKRVHVLAGEHGPHRLDRHGDHHRRPPADLGEGLLDPDQPRLEVPRVLRRFEKQNVRAPLEQAEGLRAVVDDQLVEGHSARDGHGLGRRAHRSGNETEARGGGGRGCGFARDLGRPAVDLQGLVRQVVLGEHEGRGPEGIRLDHVRAGGQVVAVHPEDDVRPGQDEVLVAALELSAPEVLRRQLLPLEPCSGGPIEDEDPLREELVERLGALLLVRAGRGLRHGTGNYARVGPGMRPPGWGPTGGTV